MDLFEFLTSESAPDLISPELVAEAHEGAKNLVRKIVEEDNFFDRAEIGRVLLNNITLTIDALIAADDRAQILEKINDLRVQR